MLDYETTITPDIFDRITQKWNEQAELCDSSTGPVWWRTGALRGAADQPARETSTLTGRALVLS